VVGKLPEAVGKLPEAVGKLPEAEGKLPEAAGRLPEAAGKLPETAGKLPETAGKLPEAAGKLPEAAGKLPEAVGKLPEVAGKLPEGSPWPLRRQLPYRGGVGTAAGGSHDFADEEAEKGCPLAEAFLPEFSTRFAKPVRKPLRGAGGDGGLLQAGQPCAAALSLTA
jgi:uncharacterized protein YjbJ (UPF0337 family)